MGLRRYCREEMLCEVGARPGLVGILPSGCLRRERLMPDGRRAVPGLVFPGRVVGEIPERTKGSSLEAATEAEVCLFSAPGGKCLAAEDAAFRVGIAADLERQYTHELNFAWLRVGLRCRAPFADVAARSQ